jgi:hypothetical protein
VRLVIPSYSLTSDTVYLFKTPHHPRLKRDWRVPMANVAMATSAAPIYFPASEFEHQRLVDGGLWANNPTMDLRQRRRGLDRGGLLQWARNGTDVLLRGQRAPGAKFRLNRSNPGVAQAGPWEPGQRHVVSANQRLKRAGAAPMADVGPWRRCAAPRTLRHEFEHQTNSYRPTRRPLRAQ